MKGTKEYTAMTRQSLLMQYGEVNFWGSHLLLSDIEKEAETYYCLHLIRRKGSLK